MKKQLDTFWIAIISFIVAIVANVYSWIVAYNKHDFLLTSLSCFIMGFLVCGAFFITALKVSRGRFHG